MTMNELYIANSGWDPETLLTIERGAFTTETKMASDAAREYADLKVLFFNSNTVYLK